MNRRAWVVVASAVVVLLAIAVYAWGWTPLQAARSASVAAAYMDRAHPDVAVH